MHTLNQAFIKIKREKRIAFMPFFVAGFPHYNTSKKLIQAAAKYADVLEISIPYSDPLADGPTIQSANVKALAGGMTTAKTFQLIRELRNAKVQTPIVLMVYANLVYRHGIEKFYKHAQEAGINGVLMPDVPLEEMGPFKYAAHRYNIDSVLLASLTTSKSRLKEIDAYGAGFTYLVSVLGTTGDRKRINPKCVQYIKRAKALRLKLPLCVGFGISSKAHARELARAGADGHIVGSALVKYILINYQNKQFISKFDTYMRSLAM